MKWKTPGPAVLGLVALAFLVLLSAKAPPAAMQPTSSAGPAPPNYMLGADANFFLGYPSMLNAGYTWTVNGVSVDPYDALVQRGVTWIRVRVWTGVGGVGGRDYAAQIVALALSKGLTPFISLMLEPDWNTANPEWTALSLDARAGAIRGYCRDTVAYFRNAGAVSGIYELGNELDAGLYGAGVYESDPQKLEDVGHMSAAIWPTVAQLAKACEDGARESDPGARFVLHTYHGYFYDISYALTFYQTMSAQGAIFDYIGMSYYPTSLNPAQLINGQWVYVTTLDRFRANVTALSQHFSRPVLIVEYAYPSTPDLPASPQVNWNHAVPGYPLTPEGQKKWLTDFLQMTYATPAIAGTFYESPEWYAFDSYWQTYNWAPFALFSSDGAAKPALDAFAVRRLFLPVVWRNSPTQ